jgi:hypothetical protein
MEQTKQFLDYAASQDDYMVTFHASIIFITIHSDASYLSKPNACNRAGGHFFLSNNSPIPENNRAILNITKIICTVMSSAVEDKLGALFINAKQAVPMQTTLE